MPIYEYENHDPAKVCQKCALRFEVIHRPGSLFLAVCPECGAALRRVVSRCRATIAHNDESHARVETEIKEYEKQGQWSHAAELAEKQSVKVKDEALRTRALDNYKNAGYDHLK